MTYITNEVNTITQYFGNDSLVVSSAPVTSLATHYWGPTYWGTHSINVKRIKLHYFYENGKDVPYLLDIDVNDSMRVKRPMDDVKVGELFAAKDYLILGDAEGVIDIIGEIIE